MTPSPDLKAAALAATPLDIEQQRREFEAARGKLFPANKAYLGWVDLYQHYRDPVVRVEFQIWCAAKRATMGSTEPAFNFTIDASGNGTRVLRWKNGSCRPAEETECAMWDALQSATPSTDAKDARLRHLYDKQMVALANPCMSYSEWLNAIDVCISGNAAIAAKELTP